MSEPLKQPDLERDPELPRELAATLRDLYTPPLTVTAAVDEDILRDARATIRASCAVPGRASGSGARTEPGTSSNLGASRRATRDPAEGSVSSV